MVSNAYMGACARTWYFTHSDSPGWLRPIQCLGTDTRKVPVICNSGCCTE